MYLLHWAQEAFIPIVLSILISYALEPIVTLMTRLHVPRFLAAAAVVLMTGAALGYGVYSLSDVASDAEAAEWVRSEGWEVLGITPSPITGPEGNVEFLLGASKI